MPSTVALPEWLGPFLILRVLGEVKAPSPAQLSGVWDLLTAIRQSDPMGDTLDRKILVVSEDTELGKIVQGWANDCWYQELVVSKESDKELVQAAEMTVFINDAEVHNPDPPEQSCQFLILPDGEVHQYD